MLVKKVMNLGRSNPQEFDFFNGNPIFIGDDEKLVVIVNTGSCLTGAVLPIPAGSKVNISEVVNPMYSLFKSGTQGAVYRVASSIECFLNITFDGLYVFNEREETYYSFDEDYDGLGDIAELYNVSITDLYEVAE